MKDWNSQLPCLKLLLQVCTTVPRSFSIVSFLSDLLIHCILFCSETVPCSVTLASLELAMYTGLASKFLQSFCLGVPNADIAHTPTTTPCLPISSLQVFLPPSSTSPIPFYPDLS